MLPTNAPQLRIVSIAGINAPSNPAGSFQAPPDVVIPALQTNPINVSLEASNIPIGTLVQVTVIPENGARTSVESSALSGTEASSSTTATITLPGGVSVIVATATVPVVLANGAPMFIEGEQVERMEVTASYGGETEVTYITKRGRRIGAKEQR
jgi:hypothetical protein